MPTVSKRVLITGGAGFIGSYLVLHLIRKYPNYYITNVDALTYAANPKNVEEAEKNNNYQFIHQNINETKSIKELIMHVNPDWIIHLAAESHVDRSIDHPSIFAETNILGTLNLLEAARDVWKGTSGKLFYQISTDEVYGSLPLQTQHLFSEETPYNPRSPYSASKAAADHLVAAFANTYGLPTIISLCSNNYGEKQGLEKLIPNTIKHIVKRTPIPVYGTGENVRDWIYVQDHVEAIDMIAHTGETGQRYNVGASNRQKNIDIVQLICDVVNKYTKTHKDAKELISFVSDRPGHDERYAINAEKLKTKLGWKPKVFFKEGLEKTVKWYLNANLF